MRRIAVLLIFSFISFISFSQKNVTTQNLAWLHYHGKVVFSKWHLDAEVEERSYISPIRQHQLMAPRLTAIFSLNENISVGIGASYFRHSRPFFPEEEVVKVANEYRPHLDIAVKVPFNKFTFNGRIRLEERWLENTNSSSDNEFNRFTRPRFLAMIKYDVTKKLALQAGNELFLNVEGNTDFNTFEHNRILAGVVFQTSQKTKLGLTYLNWYQLRSGQDYFNRHIARITFIHTIFKQD